MYVCMDCHHEFDRPKKTHNGGYYEEEWYECPDCGSTDYEELAECSECGAEKIKDHLINGMCEDCINEAASDMRKVYEYGADRTQCVEMNGVLARAFTRVQIDAILTNWLMANGDFGKEAKEYALDDTDDFSMWLNERRKRNDD